MVLVMCRKLQVLQTLRPCDPSHYYPPKCLQFSDNQSKMASGTLTTWRVWGWPGTQWREKVWSRTPVSALSLTSHPVCQMGQYHRKPDLPEKSIGSNEYLIVWPGTYTWSLATPTYRHPWPSRSPTVYTPLNPGITRSPYGGRFGSRRG